MTSMHPTSITPAKTQTVEPAYYVSNPVMWNKEVIYTPNIVNHFGQTLFQENDSYAYLWNYVITPYSKTYQINEYYGASIYKTVYIWSYSSKGPTVVWTGTVVVRNGPTPIYSEVYEIHHKFKACTPWWFWPQQKYVVNYHLFLYGDTSINYLKVTVTWQTTVTVKHLISFPVYLDPADL